MIKSAPYYWVICDRCGARHPAAGSEIAAWSKAEDALDSAACEDWQIEDDQHVCSNCALAADDRTEEDTP